MIKFLILLGALALPISVNANVMCSTDRFGNISCSDGSYTTKDRFGNTTTTGTDEYGNHYSEMCTSDRFGNTTCVR